MNHWPHAPSHRIDHPGAFIVTGATLHKKHLFDTPAKLTLLETSLLSALEQFAWQVQAWAVFPNHYHFVALSSVAESNVMATVKKLHASTAIAINRLDETPGRKVWHQAWDTRISYERSYLARLAYVHHNPVRHGLVPVAELYPWCSASWLSQRAENSWYETVTSFPTDGVNVYDDYETILPR
jgi:putative transposase